MNIFLEQTFAFDEVKEEFRPGLGCDMTSAHAVEVVEGVTRVLGVPGEVHYL